MNIIIHFRKNLDGLNVQCEGSSNFNAALSSCRTLFLLGIGLQRLLGDAGSVYLSGQFACTAHGLIRFFISPGFLVSFTVTV